MTFLWSPYDRPPMRVRRNPQAVLYRPVLDPDDWGYDHTFTPNGVAALGEAADVAVSAASMLDKAGTRGATALGAAAGFLLSTNHLRGALMGGVLGYFGGKFVVSVANKALAVVTTASKIEKVTS
jgi:hypothetical protein